jgi:cytochrome c peroxidase
MTTTTEYFRTLMEGLERPEAYQDSTKSLMILPTNMALIQDKEFKKHVERYAKDSQVIFQEFVDVVCQLFELGVSFTDQEKMTLKPTE